MSINTQAWVIVENINYLKLTKDSGIFYIKLFCSKQDAKNEATETQTVIRVEVSQI